MLAHLIPIVPILIVVVTACVVLASAWQRRDSDDVPAIVLPSVGVSAALVASLLLWYRGTEAAGPLSIDPYATFFHIVLCGVGLVTLITPETAWTSRGSRRVGGGRHALLLLGLAGMMAAVSARDLFVVFLALEVAWVASLLLIGTGQRDDGAMEGAFKALVPGVFSSAFLLYGLALLYAMTGATQLDVLASRVAASSLDPNILLLVSMALLLAGFAFVISAVPFHMWTPDACSGADARVAGFVTTGIRLAGVAVFLRVLLTSLETLRGDWLPVLSALAGLTMVVAAVGALGQSNVRRLVTYVGIAQSGVLLVGLAAASPTGKAAVVFSVVIWAAANVGAFAVLSALARATAPHDDLRDFGGLAYERPGLAALFTVCLLSLAGLPPTAGFTAKWLVFGAAIQEGLLALVVLGVLSAVVTTFVCLRLVLQMFTTGPSAARRQPFGPLRGMAGGLVVAALLLALGVWPGPLVRVALHAVAAVF